MITSGKMMRKLPQDFAFPLGLGSKRTHPENGVVQQQANQQPQVSNNRVSTISNHSNNAFAMAPSASDVVHNEAPNHSDVDTIDL